MSRCIRLLFWSILIQFSIESYSQSYFANGDAQAVLGTNCYQLTSTGMFELGSVWYADQIDISEDFDLEFYLNFGDRDLDGADGMYFVLQTVGNRAIGVSGGGMGFEGFSPSLGIEFDTWENTDLDDIPQDHIAVNINGNARHSGPNSIVSPVPARTGGFNIEDGQDHLIRIVWDQVPKILSVYFDCELRISTRINMQFDVFQGENMVYWGFTGATGGSVNTQTACLRDDILVPDSTKLCKGDTIELNARESLNDSYVWTPSTNLDNPNIRTPKCFATEPMEYEVRYLDLCGNLLIDTLFVGIDEPFTMNEAEDTLLCNSEKYFLDLRYSYDSVQWYGRVFSSQKRVEWEEEGDYQLRVWRGVCYDDDAFSITRDTTPSILLELDPSFCEGDTAFANLQVTPTDANISWYDGEIGTGSKSFTESTAGYVLARNQCGLDSIDFQVERLDVPTPDLGVDTFLCEGDSISFTTIIQGELNYLWSDGSVGNALTVYEEGSYWLEINNQEICSLRDTINIGIQYNPELPVLEDLVLCINEDFEIVIDNQNGDVVWNNLTQSNTFNLKNYEGRVDVSYSNVCSSDSSSFSVALQECICDILFPTAFTPNDDVLNSKFAAIVSCNRLGAYEQKIYNRWGELVFTSIDIEENWDGTFQGVPVQIGLYFHVTNWDGFVNGQVTRYTSKGNIYVIR